MKLTYSVLFIDQHFVTLILYLVHFLFVSDSKDTKAALSYKLFIYSWDYGLRWITCPSSKLMNSIISLSLFWFCIMHNGTMKLFISLFLNDEVFLTIVTL